MISGPCKKQPNTAEKGSPSDDVKLGLMVFEFRGCSACKPCTGRFSAGREGGQVLVVLYADFTTLWGCLWSTAVELQYPTAIQLVKLVLTMQLAVQVSEDLSRHAKLPQHPQKIQPLLGLPKRRCLVSMWGPCWCRRPGIWGCRPSPLQAPGCTVADTARSSTSCPLSSLLSCLHWDWCPHTMLADWPPSSSRLLPFCQWSILSLPCHPGTSGWCCPYRRRHSHWWTVSRVVG